MPSSSTFGRRLRALRVTLGMSQVELARRIGRHQTAIGPYERDEYEPPRDVVEKLALVLETSPEYLYFGRSPLQIALPVVGRIGRAGLLEARRAHDGAGAAARPATARLSGARRQHGAGVPAGPARLDALAAERGAGNAAGARCAGRAPGRQGPAAATLPSSDPDRWDLAAYNAPFYPWSRCKRPDPLWVSYGRGLARDRRQWSRQELIPCS